MCHLHLMRLLKVTSQSLTKVGLNLWTPQMLHTTGQSYKQGNTTVPHSAFNFNELSTNNIGQATCMHNYWKKHHYDQLCLFPNEC